MTIAAGFSDPVLDSQSCFRAIMDALARPGSVVAHQGLKGSPEGLPHLAAAVILTLCDHETTLWIDRQQAERAQTRRWIIFHTGTRLIEQHGQADFALVTTEAELPDLAEFAQGSDAYPDRSTTVILCVNALGRGDRLRLSGPGIAGTCELAVSGLPARFIPWWHANNARFPRGVDLVLVDDRHIAALPRSIRIQEA